MRKSTVILIGIALAIVALMVMGKITVEHLKTGGLFLAVLGVLVYIHEAGHFITARRNGVGCHEFGFGFPPRIFGVVKDDATGKRRWVWGNEAYHGQNTLFSMNWIPLGGFVRIKGENGTEHEPDSFAAQSVWVRFKILFAGVFMNFILAWVLMSLAMMMQTLEPVDKLAGERPLIDPAWVLEQSSVVINHVEVARATEQERDAGITPEKSPAQLMGLKVGDHVELVCAHDTGDCLPIATTEDLRAAVSTLKGQDVSLTVMRGDERLTLDGTLRAVATETKGFLGVSMAEMVPVQYPWHIAIAEGFNRVVGIIVIIFATLGALLAALFGFGASSDVMSNLSGPVGIAVFANDAKNIGFAFLLQFSAMLSANLAVLNILPIPALDGGRIVFLIIEKIKGSPVSARVEGIAHTVSFTLLMIFMLYVTTQDVVRALSQ